MSEKIQSKNLQSNDPLTQLRLLSGPEEQEKLQSDAELLALFVSGGDRRALEALVKRFAPMVASVCRLTVSDPASAEDAFQATFLVLLKSAHKIRRGTSIAAWLHGVAYRTACRIRTSRKKQLSNQSTHEVITHCDPADDPITELARRMELDALDSELEKLPERLRQPLIEHYLLGHSAPDVATRMDLSVSAVEGRLRRGRSVLRTQLARRGISLSVVLAGANWFQQHVQASDSITWTSNFWEAQFPDGELSPNLSSDPQISSLVRGETTMFSSNIISSATVKAVSVAVVTLIAGTVIALSVNAGDRTKSNRSGNSLTMPAPSSPAMENIVVAQIGGLSGGGGGGGGGLGEVALTGGGGRGKNKANNAEEDPTEPIEWERPTTDNAGATPSWLAGGQASVVSMERNRAVLAEEIQFNFAQAPLSTLVEFLSEENGTQFELNYAALEIEGIDPEIEFRAVGRGSVRELIRRACDPLELTYVVTESTIEITTKIDAEERLSIRFYDLSYVLPNSANSAALVTAIQQTIAPDSWADTAGGNCSISLVGSMMIVSATDTSHQNIEVLLLNISQMNPKNASKSEPLPQYNGGGFGGFGGGSSSMGGGMF